jgi:subtilisin-like proprotein convertase family protein
LAISFALFTAAFVVRVPLIAQMSSRPSSTGKASATPGSFDVRISAPLRARALRQFGQPPQAALAARRDQIAQALTRLKRELPGVDVTMSPLTGGVDVVRNPRGALTPPSGAANSRSVVMTFLQAQAALYGLSDDDLAALHYVGESVSPASGLRMVRLEQTVHGLPVFQSDSRFILDRQGQLVRTVGTLVPGASAAPAPAPAITASAAFVSAMQSVGIIVDPAAVATVPLGGAISDKSELRVSGDTAVAGAVVSRLVYFPLAPGVLVLAYQQTTFTSGPGDWLTIVDATNGTLLWRKNIRSYASTQQARFSVYVQADGVTPADSPAPKSPTTALPAGGTQFPEIARTIVNMTAAQDLVASPDGWIPDGGTTTTGNNVDACVDRVTGGGETNLCDAGTLDTNGRPIGNPDVSVLNRDFLGNVVRDFNYNPAPQGGNPNAGDTPTGVGVAQDAFRRGAVTQLFYITNWYHDRLFRLGFDEVAGNFQNTNFSGEGLDGDRVLAEAQDGGGTNNANFATPPDGQSGRMQMYRFTGPNPDRDGDLDAEIVMHELTHGVSNRLIANAAGLNWSVGQGMGEGWSDFYALSLLNGTNADDPNGQYAAGAYATYQLGGLTDNYVYGIRRFPYTTDNTINPLTWADVDDVTADYSGGIPISPLGFETNGAFEVHNIGELWALTLWEVRSRIIADPAGANGDVPTGNQTMLQLVTDALKLTPANPSFIDARTALLDADCATNGCANEKWIWDGFADRGLGYDAVAPLGQAGFYPTGHMGVGSSTRLPRLDMAGFTIDDGIGIGNGSGGMDPLEPVRLTVSLTNAWRGSAFGVAGATAKLISNTANVYLVDDTATFPAIAPGATVAASDTFTFVPPNFSCGAPIRLTLEVTSALGVSTQPFTIRLGLPSGTGAPVVHSFPVGPALAIPDNAPTGVSNTVIMSADDDEIADLDFRVNSITHTFTGDLTVMLRAPNGYGTDLIWLTGAASDGGPGDNFLNTVIDDQATGDLLVAPSSAAPFTGSWLPTFNVPTWSTLGEPGLFEDPVGQLSRLNGLGTAGPWTILVADNFFQDSGTLAGWSLIVTPRAFSCSAFVDPPPVTTITPTPLLPNGAAGWYVSPVNLSVSAADNIGGLVNETRCALDPGAVPATFADLPPGCAFAAPGAPLAAEGVHLLFAASNDTHANAETPVMAAFKIDATPPSLVCVLPAPTFTLNQAGAQVQANVTDALSGAAAPVASAVADTATTGDKSILVSGADVAGNIGSVSCPYKVISPPTVTIETPTTESAFSSTSPFLALTGTATDDVAVTEVTWSNDRGGSGAATGLDAWAAPVIPLQSGVNVITVTAKDGDDAIATDTLTVTFNALTYYLAEGSTGFFDLQVALANPHAVEAHTSLTFLKPDGTTVVQLRTLPPTSRTTVDVDRIAGLDVTPVSTTVASLDMLPLGVERTMSWDTAAYGGSGAEAVSQPRQRWLFAEGAQGFFRTYIMILNPNVAAATATVTFLRESGAPVTREFPMAPQSRLVVDGSTVPELAFSSFGITVDATAPVVAERAMYFGSTPARIFAGGHAAVGVPDPSTVWYFAEGATGTFFDTFLLCSNPGDVEAHVTLRYLLDDGTTVSREKVVAPHARLTVGVDAEAPELKQASFATQLTSDVPVVAERAMYWVGDPPPWTEGHDSAGIVSPGTKWVLAEGRVGGPLGHQTYILLANPSATPANVTITYLRADGTTTTGNYIVAPTSRANVSVNVQVPALHDEAFAAVVEVTNGVGIVAERSMYWNSGGVIWAGGTNVPAMRLP